MQIDAPSATTPQDDRPTPLARIRKQRAMSQAELAAAIGVTQPHMARLENRKTRLRPETAKTAAKILQCHWLELMGEPSRYTPEEEILLAFFRSLPEGDRSRWAHMMGEADLFHVVALSNFLRSLPDAQRRLLADLIGTKGL